MAVFDAELARVILRVVYDGPAQAGKTTNLRRLSERFSAPRRGDLYTPEAVNGRTLFFDWMDLDGGLVRGCSVRCQIVTVPGQVELRHRRDAILASADAVVFVVEGTRRGAARGRPLFETHRDAKVPVVLQLNKRDLPGELDRPTLLDILGAPADALTIEARAVEGVGVHETLSLAMRAAAREVEARILRDGLSAIAGAAEAPTHLLARLRELGTRPGTLADILPRPGSVPSRARRPAPQAPDAPSPGPDPAPDPAAPPAPQPHPGAPRERRVVVPSPRPPSSAPPNGLDDGAHPGFASVPPEVGAPPPFPDPDVPSGFVWPAPAGRDILRLVASIGDPEPVRDVSSRRDSSDGGANDLMLFRSGIWCLKTSPRRRYPDERSGRAALLALARAKQQIDRLLPPDTVLTLGRAEDGAYWLWTVCQWLRTTRGLMASAAAARDVERLGLALERYADAVLDSAELALDRGAALDVHPANYGVHPDGGLFYLDDDIDDAAGLPGLGRALLRRVDEYAEHPAAVERYVAYLEEQLIQRLDGPQVERLALMESIEAEPAASAASHAARRRLLGALDLARTELA